MALRTSRFKKILLIIFEIFLMADSVVLLSGGFFNIGSVITYILAVAGSLALIPFKGRTGKLRTALGNAVIIIMLLVALYCAFLLIFAFSLAPGGNEKAAVVLGAATVNDRPSLELALRLDAAVDLAGEDTDILFVTSGGTSEGDSMSQGEIMKIYMAEKGVDPTRIIPEGESFNTEENMLFTRTVLSSEGIGPDEGLVIVSGWFHIFRGYCYARAAGFSDISAYPAKVNIFAVLPDVLREALATGKMILRFAGLYPAHSAS